MKKILIAVTSLFVLASCSGSTTSGRNGFDGGSASGQYPAEVRANYLASCTANAAMSSGLSESDFVDLCKCTLEKIEDRYSLSEFLDAEQAMISGAESGLDMEAIAYSCF